MLNFYSNWGLFLEVSRVLWVDLWGHGVMWDLQRRASIIDMSSVINYQRSIDNSHEHTAGISLPEPPLTEIHSNYESHEKICVRCLYKKSQDGDAHPEI